MVVAPALAQDDVSAGATLLGFEQLRLSENRQTGGLKFAVHALPKSRCMFGDLDVITADLKRSNDQSRLQLSIESLEAKTLTVVHPLSSKHSTGERGVRKFDMEISQFAKPTVLGVFLCLTSDKETDVQPCSKKTLMKFSEMMKPHQIDLKKAIGSDGKLQPAPFVVQKKFVPHEKIYFFRFFIVDRDRLLVPTAPMNTSSYAALRSYLTSIGADVEDYDKLLERLRHYGEQLGSMPLQVKDDELQMLLPYYNGKKCGG